MGILQEEGEAGFDVGGEGGCFGSLEGCDEPFFFEETVVWGGGEINRVAAD